MSTETEMLVFAEGTTWKPIPRISRVIPFGYVIDENDPNLLQPVEFELKTLEEAKKYLKRYSLRKIAEWITQVTGRSITHEGLRNRLASERTRKSKASITKQWAKRFEETKKKLEYYQNTIGAKEAPNSNDS